MMEQTTAMEGRRKEASGRDLWTTTRTEDTAGADSSEGSVRFKYKTRDGDDGHDHDDGNAAAIFALADAKAEENKIEKKPPPCCGFCVVFRESWPRTYAILVKVILPMFLLVGVSMLFGFVLSQVESPAEFDNNDQLLRDGIILELAAEVIPNMTTQLPDVCLLSFTGQVELDDYLQNVTSTGTKILAPGLGQRTIVESMLDMYFFLRLIERLKREPPAEDGDALNLKALRRSVNNCTKRLYPAVVQFMRVATSASGNTAGGQFGGIKLDWSRCLSNVASARDELVGINKGWLKNAHPDAQHLRYKNSFFQNFYRHYRTNEIRYMRRNNLTHDFQMFDPPHFAVLKRIFLNAKDQATARNECYGNIPAAMWFWFTVMTTIGYGNTTVVTTAGRALMFTFGSFCMLLFAGITVQAGNVVSRFFDEDVSRLGLEWMKRPAIALLIRSLLYWAWLALIAYHYQQWKRTRLGDTETGFDDAYWFGFISTTTVGLGDYYLEPEVITYWDLFTFPLLFLCGFVLLASFLDKLAESLRSVSTTTRKAVLRLSRSIGGWSNQSHADSDQQPEGSLRALREPGSGSSGKFVIVDA